MEIRLEGLLKEFDGVVAVDHVDITFEDGKLTALLGPSGCGKSTILNMIAGILPPSGGRICFGGSDVARVPMEKRGVGLVFQNYSLYPHMTVLQNICFPLESRKELKKADREAKAMELAKLVRVDALLKRRPGELSGGQQQRVAIARALAKEPRILLLDEPLSNLDARLRLEMREEIRRIQLATKVTTVFVTHDQEEALSISDRIVLLKDGQVQQEAAPQEIYDRPANSFAAKFLGTPPIVLVQGEAQGRYFVSGDQQIPWSGISGVAAGTKLSLGIRAEALRVAAPGEAPDITAVLDNKYIIGRDSLATFLLNGQQVRFYLSDDHADTPIGSSLPLCFRKKGAFLFDEATGRRLDLEASHENK